jgi:predicted nucleotidyltransferase
MNIHFTDKELFERLKAASIIRVTVGSHMYGTNNAESDIDYLYIYATSDNELNSFIQTQHQFQYKENDIDHNFVSLHAFLKNTINGDSPMNFEVIHSGALKGTMLEFLYENRGMFNTYTILKAYLGMARRDAKFYYRENTDKGRLKKIGHVVRADIYCNALLNHDFDFNRCNQYLVNNSEDLKTLHIKVADASISQLRNVMNERLDSGTLGMAQKMDFENAKILSNHVFELMKNHNYLSHKAVLEDFNIDAFLNAFENWVEY